MDYQGRMKPTFDELKEAKYLNHRIFGRITENLSYEIFKYMNSKELLEIRATNLGGYQLTSNTTLRSRIKNYLKVAPFNSMTNSLIESAKFDLVFEQTGRKILFFSCMEDTQVIAFTECAKVLNNLLTLKLSTYLLILI